MDDKDKTREQLIDELIDLRRQLGELSEVSGNLDAYRAQLLDTEARYRLIAQNASDVIFLWDLVAGRFAFVSPSVKRLRQFSAEEIMQQTLLDALPPESAWMVNQDLPQRLKALAAGDESARAKTYETPQRCKDGSLIPTEVVTTLVTDPEGRPTHLLGIARDISERRSAEARLRESETQMRAIIEACTESIFLMDVAGNVLFANETTARRLGVDVATLLQHRDIHSLLPPEVAEHLRKYLRQVQEERQPVRFEDSRFGRALLHSFYPIMGEKGQVTHVAVFALDITARQAAEQALRESEERYRNLFENNHAVILLIDPENGAITDANPAACRFYGWRHEELLQKKISAINTLTPTEVFNEMTLARTQKRHQFFFKHRCADGTIRDVEVFSGPTSHEGQCLLYSIIFDVTEQKRLEEDLLTARKLEAVGTLAGGIAHDFNNILSAIRGYIELAALALPPEHGARLKLMSAEQATDQAAELTKRLITFAKGGAPVIKLGDIHALVRDTVEREVSGKTVKSAFSVASDLWQVPMDAGQIRQVFRNITQNAVEAMPHGGLVSVSLRNVTVRRQDDLPLAQGPYVRISLEDTGGGIAPDDLPFIFDPYYSTKRRGAKKGMGLGLAVCYAVVSKHHGCIQVQSTVGKGCVFHVYLPAVAAKRPATLAEPAPPDAVQTVSHKRILVMDDDATIRDVTRQLIEVMGYTVDAVADGYEAIALYAGALATQQTYDLVLLDLVVKDGIGGVMTLERLKEIDPQVKAIVFSGYTNDPVMESHQQYGFLAALPKPFSSEELRAVLEKHT